MEDECVLTTIEVLLVHIFPHGIPVSVSLKVLQVIQPLFVATVYEAPVR